MLSLLENTLSPTLDQFSFEYDNKIVEKMYPNAENLPCIFKNEPFTIFLFFKENIKLEEIKT
jgi:hypothetical protein